MVARPHVSLLSKHIVKSGLMFDPKLIVLFCFCVPMHSLFCVSHKSMVHCRDTSTIEDVHIMRARELSGDWPGGNWILDHSVEICPM